MDDELDEDTLVELNRIETMSQLIKRSEEEEEKARPSRRMDREAKQRRLMAIELALSQEGNMPSVGKIMSGLKHAREEENALSEDHLACLDRTSTSPPPALVHEKPSHEFTSSQSEQTHEQDDTEWFMGKPARHAQLSGFQCATSVDLHGLDESNDDGGGFISAAARLSGASGTGKTVNATWEPSKKALALAATKMKAWSEEIESVLQATDSVSSPTKPASTPSRPALTTITNTPSFSSPSIKGPVFEKARSFKPPSFVQKTSSIVASIGTPERSGQPNIATGFTTPARPGGAIAIGSAKRIYKSTFKTPFKKNMGLGEPGRAELEKVRQAQKDAAKKVEIQSVAQGSSKLQSFNVNSSLKSIQLQNLCALL